MNTKEKFTKIFNNNDILNINKNSKITIELLIEAFTDSYDNKTTLNTALGYATNKSASIGLKRAIKLNKPAGLHWPNYLLGLYSLKEKDLTNKPTGIKISAISNRKEYDRQYAQLNKTTKLANSKKRKLAKINRTPVWADLEKIKEIYNKCPTDYHVDHIIPLQGKLVSGLHVENNLQYLTATENLKKSNKYIIK